MSPPRNESEDEPLMINGREYRGKIDDGALVMPNGEAGMLMASLPAHPVRGEILLLVLVSWGVASYREVEIRRPGQYPVRCTVNFECERLDADGMVRFPIVHRSGS